MGSVTLGNEDASSHEAESPRKRTPQDERNADWRALSPLLDRALELDDVERERWLANLREKEPAVESRLRALLAEHERLDSAGFLAAPYGDLPAEPVSLAGQRLGAWVIERPLGSGGMGSVWLARRSDGRFEGTAAVKLLNISLLGQSGETRFRREGNALARLSHPNIARLLDAGVTAAGQPYLVLEHVDGQRIDRWCQNRSLDSAAILGLFRQVLDAVGHAHASLVVHRDIKPSNILVTPDGTVKLLDFGIAKLLEDGDGGERTAVTLEDAGALTPEFAAPEQVRGDEVTTATDVYSLGVLLYLLLSGRHPTAEASRTPADAMRALFEAEPSRLGLGDLDTVLAKTLRKTPAERYQSVAGFADDLTRFQRHEPVSARRDTLGYRSRRFLRRHRGAVASGALVAVGLVTATVFSIAQMREARRHALEAERQRDVAVYEKNRADAQLEFQDMLMSNIGTERITLREVLDRGRTLLEQEYAGDRRVAANLAVNLAQYYTELGEDDRQAEVLAWAESLSADAAPDARLKSRCSRVVNLERRHRPGEAAALLDSVRAELPRAGARERADCLSSLSDWAKVADRYDTAAALSRRALAIFDSLGVSKGTLYLGTQASLANALEGLGRGREALAIFERIIAVLDSTGRGSSVGRAILRSNVGATYANFGELVAAETAVREAVEALARVDTAGGVHPTILYGYCVTALNMRHLDVAADCFDRFRRQSRARGAEALPEEATAVYGTALTQVRGGRLAEAAKTIEELEGINARLKPELRMNAAVLQGSLAHARGDAATAMEHLRRALRTAGYFDGKRVLPMRPILTMAARVALDLREASDALEYARAAHAVSAIDSLTEMRSAFVGEARFLEARALLARGDTSGARVTLARAVAALRHGAGDKHPLTVEARGLLARLNR